MDAMHFALNLNRFDVFLRYRIRRLRRFVLNFGTPRTHVGRNDKFAPGFFRQQIGMSLGVSPNTRAVGRVLGVLRSDLFHTFDMGPRRSQINMVFGGRLNCRRSGKTHHSQMISWVARL